MARVEREWKRDKVWLLVIEERSQRRRPFKIPREKCLDAFQIQNLAFVPSPSLLSMPIFTHHLLIISTYSCYTFSKSISLNSKYFITYICIYTCKIRVDPSSMSLRRNKQFLAKGNIKSSKKNTLEIAKGYLWKFGENNLAERHIDLRAHPLF